MKKLLFVCVASVALAACAANPLKPPRPNPNSHRVVVNRTPPAAALHAYYAYPAVPSSAASAATVTGTINGEPARAPVHASTTPAASPAKADTTKQGDDHGSH